MDRLPIDILSHLSEYLALDSLFYLSFLTSKRLSRLLLSPDGVKRFVYSGNYAQTESIFPWVKLHVIPTFALRFSGLKVFSITYHPRSTLANSKSLIWPSSLTKVSVSFPDLWRYQLPSSTPNLYIEHFDPLNIALPNLYELRLTANKAFTGWAHSHVAEWMQSLPASLKVLDLGYTHETSSCLLHLPLHCELEKLFLRRSNLIPAHLLYTLVELYWEPVADDLILQNLLPLPHLRKLTIVSYHMMPILWPSFPILPNLLELFIARTTFSNQAWEVLPPLLTSFRADAHIETHLLPKSLTHLSFAVSSDQLPIIDCLPNLTSFNHENLSLSTAFQGKFPPQLTSFKSALALSRAQLEALPTTMTDLDFSGSDIEARDITLLPRQLVHLRIRAAPPFVEKDFSRLPQTLESLIIKFQDEKYGPEYENCLADTMASLLPPRLAMLKICAPLLITGAHLPEGLTTLKDTDLIDSVGNVLPFHLRNRFQLERLAKTSMLSKNIFGSHDPIYALWNIPPSVTSVQLSASVTLLSALPLAQIQQLIIKRLTSSLDIGPIMAQFSLPSLKSLHISSTPPFIEATHLSSLSSSLTELCFPKCEITLPKSANVRLPTSLTSLTLKGLSMKAAQVLLPPLKQLTFFHFMDHHELRTTHISSLPRTLTHLRLGPHPPCSSCDTSGRYKSYEKITILPRPTFIAIPPALQILEVNDAFGLMAAELDSLPSLRSVTANFIQVPFHLIDLENVLNQTFSTDLLPSIIASWFPDVNISTSGWRLQIGDNDAGEIPSTMTRLTFNLPCPSLTEYFFKTLACPLTILELPDEDTPQSIFATLPSSLTYLRFNSASLKSTNLKFLPSNLVHLHITGQSGNFSDYDSNAPQRLKTLLIDCPTLVSHSFVQSLPRSIEILRIGNCIGLNGQQLISELPPSLKRLCLFGLASNPSFNCYSVTFTAPYDRVRSREKLAAFEMESILLGTPLDSLLSFTQ